MAKTRVVFSDVSDLGYGGYMVEYGGCIANGQWTRDEAQCSFTWRELRAVRLVLESFSPQLQNKRIKWFTDNQLVLCGSKKPILHWRHWQFVKARILLEPEWIPREENEIADYISRIVDYDDWALNPLL